VIQQQLADLSAAESDGATPGTEETAPATSSVEEPSPWKPDPPGSESHASPDQDGGNAPLTEGGPAGPPVPASSRHPEASASPLDHDGRLFLDYMASLRLRGSGEGVTARAEEEEEEEEEEASDEAVGAGAEEAEHVRDGGAPGAKTREEEAGRATQRSGTERSGEPQSPSKRGRGRGGGEETAGGGGSEAAAPVRDWSPPSTRSGAKTRFSAALSTKYKDFLLMKKKKKNANRKPARRDRQ